MKQKGRRFLFRAAFLFLLGCLIVPACGNGGGGAETETWSVAGSISGDVQEGVNLALTGAASKSAASDSSGAFSFSGLADGSYTVTPSLTGFSFSPESAAVTVSGANVTGVDFAATALTTTYLISGNVSGAVSAGVAIALSGAASGSTLTDADGNFSFSGMANGNYTLSPTLDGYIFIPESQVVELSGADVTGVVFVAEPAAIYSISGTISGSVAEGVSVQLAGTATATVTTGADGGYIFTELTSGSYTISPSMDGHVFDPLALVVAVDGQDVSEQDFEATAHAGPTYDIAGTVELNGEGAADVSVHMTGPLSGSVLTGADGSYLFSGVIDGSYTMTPTKDAYTFDPATQVATVTGADVAGMDFSIFTYSISGSVHGRHGNTIAGVKIEIEPALAAAGTTDANGMFQINGVPNGSYWLIPSYDQGSTRFQPDRLLITVADDDRWDANFEMDIAFTVTGSIDYAGDRTGRVYINIEWENGGSQWGTSIPASDLPASYAIRGVSPGTFVASAYMDHLGLGGPHATSPQGNSSLFEVQASDHDLGTITLADGSVVKPNQPNELAVVPFDAGAFVMWNGPEDDQERMQAESFNLYWSTDAGVSPTSTTGGGSQTDIPASEDFGNVLQTGLTNGSVFYYVVTAVSSGLESDPSAVAGPVTIGDPTGGHTLSGNVTFEGFTATGTIWAAVVDESNQAGGFFVSTTTITGNPQAYSVPGVADGNYTLYLLVDMDDDGHVGMGDIMPQGEGGSAQVVMAGADVTADVSVSAENLATRISTRHSQNLSDNWEWYSVDLRVWPGFKMPVKVTLTDGPGALTPWDLANEWDFGAWIERNDTPPQIGDAYTLAVEFGDGSTEEVVLTVSKVLDSFATPTFPVGSVSNANQSTFQWTAPASPPTPYSYRIGLWEMNGPGVWWSEDIVSDELSAVFNFDGRAEQNTLLSGHTYHWEIRVSDQEGNEASNEVSFIPQ